MVIRLFSDLVRVLSIGHNHIQVLTIILRRHVTVRRLTQTPVKYIFSESLKIVDYGGIFINIKKFKVFQI